MNPAFIRKIENLEPTKLLSSKEMIDLGIIRNPASACIWRKNNMGPAYIRIGKKYYYPVDGLIDWLHKNYHEAGACV